MRLLFVNFECISMDSAEVLGGLQGRHTTDLQLIYEHSTQCLKCHRKLVAVQVELSTRQLYFPILFVEWLLMVVMAALS